jgi:hypothetical protein
MLERSVLAVLYFSEYTPLHGRFGGVYFLAVIGVGVESIVVISWQT